MLDADLRVVSCDRRFLELLDYPPELGQSGRLVAELHAATAIDHAAGQRWRRALITWPRPLDDARAAGGLAASARDGRIVELRSWRLPDGGFVQICTGRDLEGVGLPVPEAPARRAAPRLRAARARGRSRGQRFRDLGDAGSDWLWETDAQLRFTYLTEQFAALTGIPVEQMIGRTMIEIAGESGLDRRSCASI